MLCSKCKCEMRIVNSFAQVRDGEVLVAHDLACTNPACGKTTSSLPSRRVLSRFNGKQKGSGVFCCGAALAYTGGGEYSVPDESVLVSCENDLLTLKCPLCSKVHTLNVSDMEYVR